MVEASQAREAVSLSVVGGGERSEPEPATESGGARKGIFALAARNEVAPAPK
jgi:hypothetical protein